MKKTLLLLAVFAVILTGCGSKPLMNELDKDVYHYQNESQRFTIDLPKEFEYYQTQTKVAREGNLETGDWQDVEILIPSSDTNFLQPTPGYLTAITVRTYKSGKYKSEKGFEKINEGKDMVYAIAFWAEQPKEFKGKWNQKMMDDIKKSFKITE